MKQWVRWMLWLPLAFVVTLVLLWFAYPWLNPNLSGTDSEARERHTGVESEETILIDEEGDLEEIAGSTRTFTRAEQIERELNFLERIDSLEKENQTLQEQIQQLESELEESENVSGPEMVSVDSGEEAFQERIKSLLNLDEREMGPILEKLSQDQLVRIYNEAGNMQREKMLRALSTERSVELISEVM